MLFEKAHEDVKKSVKILMAAKRKENELLLEQAIARKQLAINNKEEILALAH